MNLYSNLIQFKYTISDQFKDQSSTDCTIQEEFKPMELWLVPSLYLQGDYYTQFAWIDFVKYILKSSGFFKFSWS